MQKRLLQGVAIASTLAAAIAVGSLWRGRALAASPADAPAPAAVAPAAPTSLPNFAGIVQQYGPAVVNVSVTGTVKTSAMSPFGQMVPTTRSSTSSGASACPSSRARC
jgi:serine protease Do